MFYLSLFIVAIILGYLSDKAENILARLVLLILSAVPLIITAGLRDDIIGFDTQAYPYTALYAASEFSANQLLIISGSIEPLYLCLGWIANLVDGKLDTLLTITHVIIIACFYIAFYRLRRFSPMWLSVFFFCFLFFNMSLQISRQMLALSVVFLGTTYLIERNLKPFILSLIIGFLFHKSAIFGVVLLPFLYFEDRKWQYITVIGVAVSFLLYSTLLSNFLSFTGLDKYEQYTAGGDFEGKMSNSELILRFVFIFLFYTKNKYRLNDVLPILLLFVTEFVLNSFQYYSGFIGRMAYFLYVMYIPYLTHYVLKEDAEESEFYDNMDGSSEVQILTPTGITILAFVVFYWWFVYIYGNAGETYPYSSKIIGI